MYVYNDKNSLHINTLIPLTLATNTFWAWSIYFRQNVHLHPSVFHLSPYNWFDEWHDIVSAYQTRIVWYFALHPLTRIMTLTKSTLLSSANVRLCPHGYSWGRRVSCSTQLKPVWQKVSDPLTWKVGRWRTDIYLYDHNTYAYVTYYYL